MLAVAVLLLVFLSEPLSDTAEAVAPAADAMSVDMDPSGNAATVLGSREICARIDQNGIQDQDEDGVDAVDLDVTITNVPAYVDNPPLGVVGPPDVGGIVAFAFDIAYDETNLTVQTSSTSFLLSNNLVSILMILSVLPPDTNGDDLFPVFVLDTGTGVPEEGSGVLARLRIAADVGAATGVYTIALANHASSGVEGFFIPDATEIGAIAIGEPCDSDLDDDGALDASESTNCHFDPDCDDDLVSDGAADPDGAGPIESGPDNCLQDANFDQLDTDSDGDGDACDTDDDNDTIADTIDNCIIVVNPGQENDVHPGTAEGDHCEDPDSDGVVDLGDNCPDDSNGGQENNDGDAEGDACDLDDDNDTVADTIDNCAFVPNLGQANNDGDSNGDVCDPDDDNDAICDPGESDVSCSGSDNCQFAPNAGQGDFDADTEGDACDTDDDDDGTPDTSDPDDDNDGVYDIDEANCDGSTPSNLIPERIDGAFGGVDDDGNDGADEALPPGAESFDCDGDGFTGADEALIFSGVGGLDQDPCGTDGWALEFDSGTPPDSANKINIRDLSTFILPVRRMGTSVGDGDFDIRWDLDPGPGVFGKDINVADLQAMVFSFPPMFGGATRAFSGPVCPWAP